MNTDRKNAEGYYDPTAYEALTAVVQEEKRKTYRPLVYICSPFAGDVSGNIAQARKYCRFAVEQGAIPLAPHLLYPQFMDDNDKTERALGLFFGVVLLGKCDEVWAFCETPHGARVASFGMKAELSKARGRGIPIKFFNRDGERI